MVKCSIRLPRQRPADTGPHWETAARSRMHRMSAGRGRRQLGTHRGSEAEGVRHGRWRCVLKHEHVSLSAISMSLIKGKQLNIVGIWPQNYLLFLPLYAFKRFAVWTIRYQISKCPNVSYNMICFHSLISILSIFPDFLENNILSETPCS